MIVDLDSFRLINDLYGHEVGDKMLINCAELIKEKICASDLAGRLGGDTFVVFRQDIQDKSVVIENHILLNENLLLAAEKIVGKHLSIPFGASAGAVFVPDDGTDFSLLCDKANNVLYEAKQNSKHECLFYGSDDKQSERKKLLDVQRIFGERFISKFISNRAYFVDINGFREVYRMFVRFSVNYRKDLQIMQVTLDTENSQALDVFRELLLESLQQSDCVTQNGKKQFLVLMPETHFEERDGIKERIISNWRSSTFSKFFTPRFEFESIDHM